MRGSQRLCRSLGYHMSPLLQTIVTDADTISEWDAELSSRLRDAV